MIRLKIVGLLLLFSTSALAMKPMAVDIKPNEVKEIGIEAYHYLYPLVLMEVTRRVFLNAPVGSKPGAGPANSFSHMREFPSASFRDVVRPNFDTLYSAAWLDLNPEPVILSVPDTNGRYYLMPLLDMWSNVFAVPGKRTTGTQAGHFAIVPQGWKGTLPKGVARIDAPTRHVWIIGRTQTNGPADYPEVHKIQDQYKLTPLSQWGKPRPVAKVKIDPSVDLKTDPLTQVQRLSAEEFFSLAMPLLKDNPPHLTDWSLLARMRRIGLVPSHEKIWGSLTNEVKSELMKVPAEAQKIMQDKIPTMARAVNGWQMNTDTMGVYGNYYLKRAIVAMVGLGANQPEDAIYPMIIGDAKGRPVEGQKKYVLHFDKKDLPPVSAFWSVTMYDEEGFQVANKINRFAIGDRDALKFNSDGSLDLYIQSESPGAERESNWLPAPPKGKLGLTMRLYAPGAEVLDGRWAPPALQMVK